ncbi:MAG: hypothetical protein DRR08_01695 [Candidatus Parabeggiatoa sp. nov. 2]|nr:MAG: hypothetical protein B6247_00205 [Beggiatoa sp. 4572_84]RKZ64088.1 MAG: hypothetical protein DRR08_01695 [Gammaproteobacteria bacterium]HEC85433.1 PKD domain-containing protein [Thioploca sp.]
MKTIGCNDTRRLLRHWKTGLVSLLGLLFGNVGAYAETIEATRTFEGHTNSVESVVFSPDGKHILSGSYDNTIKLWNVDTGKVVHTFQGHSDFVMSVGFSPDGKDVLSGSADNTLKRWNALTGEEIDTFQRNIGWFYSVAFSPKENSAILSGSRDNTPKLWNTLKGTETDSLQGHEDWVYLVALSNDGSKALSASEDGTIKVWDIDTGKEITFKESGTWAAAVSNDGSKVLAGSDKGTLKLLDVDTGQEIRTFSGHSGRVYSVAFSPDDSLALSGGHDGTIKVWEIETGKEIHSLEGHTDIVSSVAFSPVGNDVLSGSYDNTIKLWEIDFSSSPPDGQPGSEDGKIPPIAKLEASPLSGKAPLNVALDGSDSYDPDGGDIVSYKWIAANGETTLTVSGSTANLTFDKEGEYTLMLVIKDDEGQTASDSETIMVGNFTYATLEGLQYAYNVGDSIVLDVVVLNLMKPLDLWAVIEMPDGHLLFRIALPKKPPFTPEPLPFKKAVDNHSEIPISLEILNKVPEGIGGDYTLYVFFTEANKNPFKDGHNVLRSNLIFEEITLAND